MTYSMIVVDDERLIREGLKRFIQKNQSDFAVEQVFEDGKQVIEYLQTHTVDLILTDIRMIEVSGLEVAAYVFENMPQTDVIILSGYQDFEYAQTAIENRVFRYLLKPIDNAALLAALHEVKESRDKRLRKEADLAKYMEMLRQVRNDFFVDFVYGGKLFDEAAAQRYAGLGFPFDAKSGFTAILRVSWPEEFLKVWVYGEDGAHTALVNFFSDRERARFGCFLGDDRYLLLSGEDIAAQVLGELKAWVFETFHTNVEAQILYTGRGMDELGEYVVLMRKNEISTESPEGAQVKHILLNTYIQLNMQREAAEIFANCRPDEALRFLAAHAAKASGARQADFSEYIRRLEDGDDPEDVFLAVYQAMTAGRAEEKAVIVKLKEYLNDHYAEDISLQTAAEAVYLQPVYMSRFFKEQTGMTFSEYLLNIRMANAIRLLKTNRFKIHEIAEKVGYKDAKYFSKQFRGYTGYTPKDFTRLF